MVIEVNKVIKGDDAVKGFIAIILGGAVDGEDAINGEVLIDGGVLGGEGASIDIAGAYLSSDHIFGIFAGEVAGIAIGCGGCALQQFRCQGRLSGQKRWFGDVRATSALPPKTDIHREGRHVRKVP